MHSIQATLFLFAKTGLISKSLDSCEHQIPCVALNLPVLHGELKLNDSFIAGR